MLRRVGIRNFWRPGSGCAASQYLPYTKLITSGPADGRLRDVSSSGHAPVLFDVDLVVFLGSSAGRGYWVKVYCGVGKEFRFQARIVKIALGPGLMRSKRLKLPRAPKTPRYKIFIGLRARKTSS